MKRLIIKRYVKIGLQGFLSLFKKKPGVLNVSESETDFDKILITHLKHTGKINGWDTWEPVGLETATN